MKSEKSQGLFLRFTRGSLHTRLPQAPAALNTLSALCLCRCHQHGFLAVNKTDLQTRVDAVS